MIGSGRVGITGLKSKGGHAKFGLCRSALGKPEIETNGSSRKVVKTGRQMRLCGDPAFDGPPNDSSCVEKLHNPRPDPPQQAAEGRQDLEPRIPDIKLCRVDRSAVKEGRHRAAFEDPMSTADLDDQGFAKTGNCKTQTYRHTLKVWQA